jgi:hypothetical protein
MQAITGKMSIFSVLTHHPMEAHECLEVYPHVFLSPILDEHGEFASCPIALLPDEFPSTHWTGGCMRHRDSLVYQRKLPLLIQILSRVAQPVTSNSIVSAITLL